jgi:capsular exopolysaccharide synthesis family protein
MNSIPQTIAPHFQHLARPLPRSVQAPPEPASGPLQELAIILRRRWRVIAGTVLVVLGATGLYCRLATPWYEGQATILIEPKALQVLNGQDQGGAEGALTSTKYDYYATQFQLMRSPTLAERVIRELDLGHDAHFTAGLPPAATTPGANGAIPPALVNAYLKNLTVLPFRGTRLVALQYLSTNAQLAADVANAHARLFVAGGLERLYAATEQVRDFLTKKLTELQDRRQEAEVKLLKFQSAHNLLPIDLTKDAASERFMELNRRLTAAEAERMTLEAQYDVVQRHAYDSLPAVLTSPLIQKIREEYDRLDVEHSLLAQKFRPTYPRLRQLSGQLAHAREQLHDESAKVAASVEASYLAAKGTVEQLKTELDAQREALLGRKDTEGEFLALTRDVETTRALYDSLLTRVKDLSIAGSAEASNISLAEPAVPASSPAIPTTKLYLLLGFVTSLVLGGGLAFVRDSMDRTIRDAADLHRATGLRTLAIVPDFSIPMFATPVILARRRVKNARRRLKYGWRRIGEMAFGLEATHPMAAGLMPPPLLLGNGVMPLRAEPYRTLRTALLLGSGTAPQAILVSSAGAAEGKTTTAVNVAAALARCGASVLLIDADLRLPRCHLALETASEPGLTDFLSGRLASEPIVPTHVDNLSFLPAGSLVDNPAELLTSEAMSAMLRGARERFNFIVIDSAPLLAVSDGYLLGNLADGVLVVAESGRSRHDRLRVALQRLYQSGATPLGLVLNRGPVEQEYYGYRRTVRNTPGGASPLPHTGAPTAPTASTPPPAPTAAHTGVRA